MELDLRVQPKAGRNGIRIDGDRSSCGEAAPEGGKANAAVVTLLTKPLKVPGGRVRIAPRHRGRHKRSPRRTPAA